jgi:hypothetical protein
VRKDYHRFYYGAYVRDLDGNNVECVCHMPPALLWATSWPVILGGVGMILCSVRELMLGILAGGLGKYFSLY